MAQTTDAILNTSSYFTEKMPSTEDISARVVAILFHVTFSSLGS